MDITTTIILIGIGFSLFLGGFFLNKNAYFLTFFGALIIMVLGIYILGDAIEIRTGSTITYNSTTNIDKVSYNYERLDYNINQLIGMTLVLLGLAGSLVGYNKYNTEKNNKKKDYQDSFDD